MLARTRLIHISLSLIILSVLFLAPLHAVGEHSGNHDDSCQSCVLINALRSGAEIHGAILSICELQLLDEVSPIESISPSAILIDSASARGPPFLL